MRWWRQWRPGGGVAQTYTIGGAISGLSASGLTIADGSQTVSPGWKCDLLRFPELGAFGHSGRQVTTKTDSTGQYALSTVGLSAPFLVSVVTGAASSNGYPAGTTFYSVSDQAAPTVINITPLTDLLVREWYATRDSPVDIATAFAKPASNPPPTMSEAQLLNAAILDFVQPVLQQDGVDPVGLDLISTLRPAFFVTESWARCE